MQGIYRDFGVLNRPRIRNLRQISTRQLSSFWPLDTLSALESPGDVDPPEDPAYLRVVHQIMLVDRGINLIENMYLDELVRDKVYEFLFILAAPKLKGGTAFPVEPIAII
jgi:kynurenine formamidase